MDGEAGRPDIVTCSKGFSMMVRSETEKLWYDTAHGDGEYFDLVQPIL